MRVAELRGNDRNDPIPSRSAPGSFHRRDILKTGAAVLAAAALPPGIPALAESGGDHSVLLHSVGDIIVPPTLTAGAGAPDVIDFVLRAVAHGIRGAMPDLLDRLIAELDHRAGASFLAASPITQKGVVEALDAAVYAGGGPRGNPWPLVKTLILMGYYTSETGGSKELNYELTPGRFDPDIPVLKGDKAFSSDWSGVAFRNAGPM